MRKATLAVIPLVMGLLPAAASSDATPAKEFRIERYTLKIPSTYDPKFGVPGDPRRSDYVFMVVQSKLMKIPRPKDVTGPGITAFYMSIQIEKSDAARLAFYKSLPVTKKLRPYGTYDGFEVANGETLYLNRDNTAPAYLTCLGSLGNPASLSPVLCNVTETIDASGAPLDGVLTVQYTIRENYWPVLRQIDEAARETAAAMIETRK